MGALKGISMSLSGRKRDDGIDFYSTPKWAIEELLKKEQFSGSILEPFSGSGAISKVLENYGYTVYSSDLREDKNVYGYKGIDLFEIEKTIANNIISNPPYFCATEAIEKCLDLVPKGGNVAMILKLSFLESAKRYEFWKRTPLKKIYVFCKRVVFWNELLQPDDGTRSKHGGTIPFAWYIWEKGYKGEPTIDWIL